MKRRISIFTLLFCAFAAVAAVGEEVMRLSPIGYRLGETGDVTAYASGVVTVAPSGTSIVKDGKPITLTAALNRDYKVICWQKFDVNPTIRTSADPIEEFGKGAESVSVAYDADVQWMYVVVIVRYDPVRTVKAALSSFGKGDVSVSPEKTSYQKGDEVTLTAEPAGGYSFVRWSDGNADHKRTLIVDDDIDLTAYIEPNENRVSFSAGEGAVLDMTEKTVRFGYAYGELPVPVRGGQVFVGWKNEFGTMITSESTSGRVGDHVLTAVWEIPPESYTVVFDANGGTGTQIRVNQAFEVGVAQKLRMNTFYKPGSVFVGWNQYASAEEKQYADEQIVQDLAPAGAALTLFAIWRAEKVAYTVHFDKNADDATGEMIGQQFAGGEEKPLSGCNFKRTGWAFLGWSTDSEAIEPTYHDREKVRDLTTQKELTLYAVWTKNPVYYVHYMKMGRDTEDWKSETVEQRKEYTLSTTNGLDRTGYTFAGWTNGTAKATYPAGKKCTTQELEKMVDEGDTISFVAVWNPITYTLKFDGNGGMCKLMPKTLTYDRPATIEFEGGKVSRDHYEFKFWSADPKETNLVYRWNSSSEPVVTNLTTVADDTVVWYAIWKGTNVTVKVNNEDKQLEYGSQLDKPADPVKTGYTFAGGWQTNGVPVTFPITVTGGFDLYSEDEWTPIEYAVSFHGTDGTYETDGTMADQPFTYDVEQALTSNGFTRTGYTFANWTNVVGKTFTDGARVKNLATNNGAVVDLYATWTMNPHYYTVRFDGNGADGGSMATNRFECGKGGKLPVNGFTRMGYAFGQWTNETATGMSPPLLDDGATFTVDLAPTNETATLSVLWTPNRYWVAFDANGGAGSMAAQEFTYDEAQALTSNAFTRTGYEFAGWATNATTTGMSPPLLGDGAVVSNLTAEADATNTLFAAWAPNKYTVVIDGVSTEMDYGSDIGKPADPAARDGYTFADWTTNGAPVATWPLKVPVGGLEIGSAWTTNTYAVEFRGPGEAYTQDFTYDTPQALEANRFPAPEWKVFDRWTNAVDSTAYTNCETVCNLATGGVFVLYATWKEAPSYTVAFDGNGADGGSMANLRLECGKGGVLASNRFTRTGYAFNQWTNETATGMSPPLLSDGATFTVDLAPTNGTATLSALWTPNRYWVAFDGNGVDDGTMVAQEFTYDIAQTLTSNAFTKTGHAFGGWKTNETGLAVYGDGAVVSNLTAVADATNTLWAAWTANNYKVKFYSNGGSSEMDDQSFTYDQSQTLAKNTFRSPESWKVFAGWATNATGVVVYGDEETVSNLTTVADGQVDLYAVWGDDSYTVTFNGNDATGGTMEPQIFKHGGTGRLASNAYTRTGHSFKNWTNDAVGVYSDGADFTAPANGAGMTLYAAWTVNAYKYTFDDVTKSKEYGEAINPPQPAPTKTGYTFKGWTTNGTDIIDFTGFTMPDHDVVFTPMWDPITYTIAFDGNGATTVAMVPTNVKYDVEFALPPNTYVREGYEFVQWTNSVEETFSDGATVQNLATTDGVTVTLYAEWQETGNPLAIALGLDANFEVESIKGAWTVIGEPKGKNGLQRTSVDDLAYLEIQIPGAGQLYFEFYYDKSIYSELDVLFNDESIYDDSGYPAEYQGDAKPMLTFKDGGTLKFSGGPDKDATWTLKNFEWIPAK